MTRWTVTPTCPDLRDNLDRALLQALLDGVQRTSLPAHLSVSKRQVSRRLNELCALASATSWVALGATACDRGWITARE